MMRPAQTTVPDLSGDTFSAAATKLKSAGLAIGNQTSVQDATKVPGTIVSQAPAPNSSVKSGTAVDIVLAQSGAQVEVPRLTGRSLDTAETIIRDYHLAVGTISQEPRPEAAPNTVIDEFPKAGRRVNQGSAIDLVVAGPAASPGSGAPQTVTPAQPVKSPDKPPAPLNIPRFAGTWKLYETSTAGRTEATTTANSLVIAQKGSTVHLDGRDLSITSAGTVTYQTYFAADGKAGHAVANEEQADLVDTFTWRLEGSDLVFETIFDYRHEYFNHPTGRSVRVMRYERVQ